MHSNRQTDRWIDAHRHNRTHQQTDRQTSTQFKKITHTHKLDYRLNSGFKGDVRLFEMKFG